MAPSIKSKEQTKALVTRPQTGKALSLALDPESQKVYNVCLALSKSSAIPMAYINKPDWIFSTVVLGKEFGLAPMTSLMNISTINGKPSMSVHLMLGLCMRHPQFAGYREVKSNKDECEIEMFRKWPGQDKPFKYEGSYSLAEARMAGLVKNGGAWMSYPKNMCFARAVAFACRKAFADVLTGTYTLEEMDSEKYVDSFMADDLKAIDGLEASELSGKAPESVEESPKSRTPIQQQKGRKLAPNR